MSLRGPESIGLPLKPSFDGNVGGVDFKRGLLVYKTICQRPEAGEAREGPWQGDEARRQRRASCRIAAVDSRPAPRSRSCAAPPAI
jgi:hypothetical protein